MSREELFLSQLAVIKQVVAWVAARRGLARAEAEDLQSLVMVRLIENDYEILAKFEGRSSLKTYLVTVVNHIYLDFQVQRFGKWRSSAQARRLGAVALRLERLLYRDGLPFDEACGVILSGEGVQESRDSLYAMSLSLPNRLPTRAGEAEVSTKASEHAAAALERAERQAIADRTFAVIRRSLRALPHEDREFLRLHFEYGFTVAQAARSLGLEQRTLYGRKDNILDELHTAIVAAGVQAREVQELLATLDWDAVLVSEDSEE